MSTRTCTAYCSDHRTETDPVDGSVTEVCRAKITRGEITVEIETSPSWDGPADLPIVTDEVVAVDAAGARDYAAALLAAAQVLDPQ